MSLPFRRPHAILRRLSLALVLPVFAFAQTPGPGPSPAPAVPPAAATEGEGTIGPIKFGDLTVDAALDMLERWSGRSVLRPNALPATSLTFNLDQKITKAEAQRALETLLTLNGIAVTPLGQKFLKVTALAAAKGESPEFIEGSALDLPASGRISSKLFQLKFLRVGEFMPQLAGVLNPAAGSAPVVFEKANSALITDTVSNLQRVEMLAARLDQPSLEGLVPKFYKLRHTSASDIVGKLQALLSGAAATQIGTGTTFQADDRTNQILLLSDPRQHGFFDEIIAKLDGDSEANTRQEVIPLKHANAPDVATLLSQLVSGQTGGGGSSGGRTTPGNPPAGIRPGGAPGNLGFNNAGGGIGGANRPGAPGAAPTPPTAPAANPAPTAFNLSLASLQSNQQQFSTVLTIVADTRSNSLVVSGTADDIKLIKSIVDQLDVLLAQVRIEVVIAEITLDNQISTGIDALGLVVSGNKLVGFSGSGPGFSVSGAPTTTGAATPFATLFDAAGKRSLSALINLGTQPRKSNTHILSVPNIVTTHNKQASIFVGEQRPVISSYLNNGANTGNIGAGFSSTVTYKNIGIQLTVTPLIGNDGSVQLDIQQQVEDVLSTVTIDGNSQPIIGSRSTQSFISVNSGDIIVLGGLQRHFKTNSSTRVGGLPIIGDLLGNRQKGDTRTDLVFFLRPYVLTNTPADNEEALRRLEHSPQQDDVNAALHGALAPTKR
jgi:general secretion pathway protein D